MALSDRATMSNLDYPGWEKWDCSSLIAPNQWTSTQTSKTAPNLPNAKKYRNNSINSNIWGLRRIGSLKLMIYSVPKWRSRFGTNGDRFGVENASKSWISRPGADLGSQKCWTVARFLQNVAKSSRQSFRTGVGPGSDPGRTGVASGSHRPLIEGSIYFRVTDVLRDPKTPSNYFLVEIERFDFMHDRGITCSNHNVGLSKLILFY